jgi:hypothetical protein
MTCWRVRKCTVGGLERCTVAASAEAYMVMNRPKAKAERIAMLQSTYRHSARVALPAYRDANGPSIAQPGGHEGELGPFQRAALGAAREIAR